MSDFWTCEECGSKGYCLISATGMRTCANCGWSLRIKTLLQRDEAATRQIEGLKAEIAALWAKQMSQANYEAAMAPGLRTLQQRVDLLEREFEDMRRWRR